MLDLESARLLRCMTCGLVRVDPYPDEASAQQLYDASYFRDPVRGYRDYREDKVLLAREMRRRLIALEALGVGPRLLDVGCATGVLLEAARARGFRPRGIEVDRRIAQEATEASGCPVMAGPLERALLAAASCDVVTLFDVLEHMHDPRRALERLRHALLPRGWVAITVPDYGGAWARLSGRRWPFLTPWEHLTYFTQDTLLDLLGRAGFCQARVLRARTPCPASSVWSHVRGREPGDKPPSWLRGRGVLLPFGTLYVAACVAPRGVGASAC